MASAAPGGRQEGSKNKSQFLSIEHHHAELFSIDQFKVAGNKDGLRFNFCGKVSISLNKKGIKQLKEMISQAEKEMEEAIRSHNAWLEKMKNTPIKFK